MQSFVCIVECRFRQLYSYTHVRLSDLRLEKCTSTRSLQVFGGLHNEPWSSAYQVQHSTPMPLLLLLCLVSHISVCFDSVIWLLSHVTTCISVWRYCLENEKWNQNFGENLSLFHMDFEHNAVLKWPHVSYCICVCVCVCSCDALHFFLCCARVLSNLIVFRLHIFQFIDLSPTTHLFKFGVLSGIPVVPTSGFLVEHYLYSFAFMSCFCLDCTYFNSLTRPLQGTFFKFGVLTGIQVIPTSGFFIEHYLYSFAFMSCFCFIFSTVDICTLQNTQADD